MTVKDKYGEIELENGYISCFITNDDWLFGITVFQDLGLVLHCFVIVYSCCKNKKFNAPEPIKCYHNNIMKNYSKFIGIYVLLWIPSMVYGILIKITNDKKKMLFWMEIFQKGFIISTGLANGLIWYNNKGTDPRSDKLIKIDFKKSPPILNKNKDRIGINNSGIITFTCKPLSGVNTKSNINTDTTTPSKPLDYDPASKIGPRSMYNGDDDTPTMMLIDNTVNEYQYKLTSTTVTQDDHKQETRLF